MVWTDLLAMRNEVLLTIAAFLLLCAELFFSDARKHLIPRIAIVLVGLISLGALVPQDTAVLFGGMFQTGALVANMKTILNLGTLIVLMQSTSWFDKAENRDKQSEYIVLMLSTLIGMDFMISAGHFLMFTVGLELATIPIAGLAAFQKHESKSSEAGIKLLLLAALSSGITMFGLSMIYGAYGSLYFSDLSQRMSLGSVQALGCIFFLAGLAFKISLVPFHLWTADVYEGAPVNVSSYLSVISKGAAVFILVITAFSVFRNLVGLWVPILNVLAVLTMTVGNLFAIRQHNLKRFLAFSSIAQAGFILLGVSAASQVGMSSVLYFVFIYIFSNLGAFGVVSVISAQYGKEEIEDYNGLYKTNPMLSLTMMLALFSLAGIPPAAGFFGKLFLFAAVAQKGTYWLLIIATVNATISLYYYLLVVKAMFISSNDTPLEHFKSSAMVRASLVFCVIGILVVGFASAIYDGLYSLSTGI